MEVITKKLIHHQFDITELLKRISPNCLKQENLEWNEEENLNHPFCENIQNSDLAISIENIDEPHEEYAYFFIDIKTSICGNKAYTFKKVVFDINLTDEFINCCVPMIIDILITEDITINNRVILINNYSLGRNHLNNTKQKAITELIQKFYIAKNGLVPDELIKNLGTITLLAQK